MLTDVVAKALKVAIEREKKLARQKTLKPATKLPAKPVEIVTEVVPPIKLPTKPIKEPIRSKSVAKKVAKEDLSQTKSSVWLERTDRATSLLFTKTVHSRNLGASYLSVMSKT